MSNIFTKSKKKRLSLFVNSELSERVNQISKQSKLTISEIVRNALQEYVCKLEKLKLNLNWKPDIKLITIII